MAAVPSSPRVKLRTTSRRVPRTRTAPATTDDPPEPTMRLSRAIMVMLLLHVVAVGGFFASSVLKERDLKRSSVDPTSAVEEEDARVPSTDPAKTMPAKVNVHPNVHVVRPGETLTLIANETGVSLEALVAANGADTVTNGLRTGQELKLPDRSPDPGAASSGSTDSALSVIEGRSKTTNPSNEGSSSTPRASHPTSDTGKIYVVGKGENAYTIAHKNNVSYEALLKLNQIADPKRIQPGQKLRLPLATSKPKVR